MASVLATTTSFGEEATYILESIRTGAQVDSEASESDVR